LEISEAIVHGPLVLLTGAGASVPLGKLTTEGFVKHLFDVAGTYKAQDERASQILRDAIGRAIGEGLDVEDVLAALEKRTLSLQLLEEDAELQRLLPCDRSRAAMLREWIDEARNFIYDQVIEHYSAIDAAGAADLYKILLVHLDPWLGPILGRAVRTLPFFTLNYDRAVEVACSTLGVRCVDGITDVAGKTERRWVRTVFGQYEEREDVRSVVLVKLHGSVRLGRRPMAVHGLADAELVELPEEIHRDPKPYTHAVIYPSRLPKDLTSEPFYTHYRVFNACLQHARLLLVIGCSMRDPDVQIAVRTAVEDNPQLRILVVDPHADHDELASRLHIPAERIAVERRHFDIEPSAERGMSSFMGMVRGYLAAALEIEPGFPFVFGRTNEAAASPVALAQAAVVGGPP